MLMHCVNLIDVSVESEQTVVVKGVGRSVSVMQESRPPKSSTAAVVRLVIEPRGIPHNLGIHHRLFTA